MKIPFLSVLFLLINTIAFSQNNIKIIDEEKQPTTNQEETDKSEEVFLIVDTPPQYPGGVKVLVEFIAQNTVYPEKARKKDIQGKVYIQFIVNKQGKVVKAKVVRGAHPLLDQAALDVVNKIPDWTPGKQAGEYVNVYYTIPINFTLGDDEDDKKKKKKKRRG